MISRWKNAWKAIGRPRLATRLAVAGISLFSLGTPFAAEAQPSLTQPNPGATFTAEHVCPAPTCPAAVPYSIGVSGAPVDRVELILTNDADGFPFVVRVCARADFDTTVVCPTPNFSFAGTIGAGVGTWTLAARVVRGAAVETSDPVPFTVLPSAAALPGPVKIVSVAPSSASPAMRVRDASPPFQAGELTTPDEIVIRGENLADNPFLTVYLAPKPSFEVAISAQSEPLTSDWCKLQAEIVQRVPLGGTASLLRVRLPEVPLFMHTTCGGDPQGFSNSFDKDWRWAIRDGWPRPERGHEWIATPPQRSHPGHDGPPFRLIKPPYPTIDGFKFRNQKTDATYKEFLSVFGNNAYICLGAFGVCATRVPDPTYHTFWWPIYMWAIDSTGGSCNGMAATSLLMAREDLQPEGFEPDVHFPVGLDTTLDATYDGDWCAPYCGPFTPTNLWATIRMNHGVQISAQFLHEIIDTLGEAIFDPTNITSIRGVPEATLQRVAANPLGYVLCFFQPGKGHCVAPYRVDGNRIWIYDSNYPKDAANTYIDITSDGDYHYPYRPNEPNRGKAIMAFPIEIWKEGRSLFGLNDLTTVGGLQFLQMLAFGDADVVVTNDAGGRWGWEDDGSFTDNLLGAIALPPLGPPEEPVHQMPLLLAMNQPAPKVQINAKGGRYYFHTAEGRLSLQIEAADAQAGDKDRVQLAYGAGRLAAAAFTPARRANHVVARAALAIGDTERALFHLVGLDVPAGRTVQVGGDVATRTLTYRNDTGGTTHHFVQLDYVAGPAEAHGRLLYGPFEVPQGASHRVVLSGWPDVSGVRAGLDFDSNGTVDRQQIVTGRPVVAPTDLQASADLSIEKVASVSELLPGDEIAYTVTVRNNGPAAATAVRLDDALPPYVTAVQPTTTLGTCEVAALGVTCQLGSLGVGEAAAVQYTIVPMRPGFLANGATVAGAEGDPDWTNNTAVVVADVRARIDILPGSDINPINAGKPGKTPVAVLGGDGFDVMTLDAASLRFGPGGASGRQTSVEDVNRDGFPDLVGHFERRDAGIAAGDTAACVRGLTLLGAQFRGCDAVRVVPK